MKNKFLFLFVFLVGVSILGCTAFNKAEPEIVKEIVVYNTTNCPTISCPPQAPTKIEVYFCPRDNCVNRLIGMIASANKSVHIAIYSLTKQDIADALIDRRNASVNVFVIMDKSQAAGQYSVDEYLIEHDVNVIIKRGSGGGLMHNKIIVIDGKIVCTGSMNYSIGGDEKNDENLICIFSETLAKQYENYLESLL